MSKFSILLPSLLPSGLSFALACGPSSSSSESGTPSGDDSSSTVGDETSNAATSSTATSSTATSSTATSTSGPGGEATGASSSSTAGSSEGGDDSTGGAPSMFGRYALTGGAAVLEPVGCASEAGDDAPWAITLGEPADDGTFAMQESYGDLGNAFACTETDDGFGCDAMVTVDYAAMGGPDANVQLTAHYGVTWAEAGSIDGTYDVGFACDGAACGDVVEQWNVLGFPCDIAVDFTGVLE